MIDRQSGAVVMTRIRVGRTRRRHWSFRRGRTLSIVVERATDRLTVDVFTAATGTLPYDGGCRRLIAARLARY